MNIKAQELRELIEIFKNDFYDLDESLTAIRISKDKWTLKEIIGHLIDSASNNHQRFVRLQLSDALEFPDYDAAEWLNIENHQHMEFKELLLLFYYYNKLLINIVSNMDEKCLKNKWDVAWDENTEFITLESLVTHYVNHMKIHLDHFKGRLNEVINN